MNLSEETMHQLDIVEIQKILPHRYPMLLIDRVLDYVPGEKVVAKKNVSVNEAFFQGHFPGNPVMPGVLIVEAMAQAGAIALLTVPEFKGKTAYFGGMNKVKFRQMVKPGDTLRLEVTLDKIRGNAGLGHGVAYVDDHKVCSGDLTFMIG